MPATSYRFERPNQDQLEIRRVTTVANPTAAIVAEDARHVGRVMHAAYSRDLASWGGKPRPIELNRHFGNRGLNRQNAVRMAASISVGSTYWLAFNHLEGVSQPLQAIGVAKATPSQPRWRKWGDPNCYINDLEVSMSDASLGSALLFAAIGDYEPKREVVTDTFKSAPEAKVRFYHLGFEAKPLSHPHPTIIGDRNLEMFRMGGVKVGDLRATLIEQNPWLVSPEVC